MLTALAHERSMELTDLERAFQLAGRAMIVVNRARQVVAISAQAEPFIGGEVRLIGRRLALTDPVLNARLSGLIDACVCYDRDEGGPLPPPITFSSPRGPAISIDVWPSAQSGRMDHYEPAAIVLIREAQLAPDRIEQLLHRLYGLTRREAHVAIALGDNATLAEVAARLAISILTVRAHLKAIFSKTGTHRQVELVSLIGKLSR